MFQFGIIPNDFLNSTIRVIQFKISFTGVETQKIPEFILFISFICTWISDLNSVDNLEFLRNRGSLIIDLYTSLNNIYFYWWVGWISGLEIDVTFFNHFFLECKKLEQIQWVELILEVSKFWFPEIPGILIFKPKLTFLNENQKNGEFTLHMIYTFSMGSHEIHSQGKSIKIEESTLVIIFEIFTQK